MFYRHTYDEGPGLESVLTEAIDAVISRVKKPSPDTLSLFLKEAKNLAHQYASGTGIFTNQLHEPYFLKVPRRIFAKQLKERLENPETTHQGGTYLCGPSASVHLLLNLDPLNYLKVAILLFETGKGRIGGGSDEFHVSKAMRNVWNLDSEGLVCQTEGPRGTMGIIDYIMVGSLRNAENLGTADSPRKDSFDPQTGGGLGAWSDEFTPPHDMNDFLKDYCGFELSKSRWATSSEDPSHFQEALKAGKRIILFIDPQLSAEEDPKVAKKEAKGKPDKAWKKGSKVGNYTGTHFVVIRPERDFVITDRRNGSKGVMFSYWDYGGRTVNIETTVAQFQSSVKGYWFVNPKYK